MHLNIFRIIHVCITSTIKFGRLTRYSFLYKDQIFLVNLTSHSVTFNAMAANKAYNFVSMNMGMDCHQN